MTLVAGCGLGYFLFLGGARRYTSPQAQVVKIIILVIIGAVLLSGFLLIFRGDKRRLHQLAHRDFLNIKSMSTW